LSAILPTRTRTNCRTRTNFWVKFCQCTIVWTGLYTSIYFYISVSEIEFHDFGNTVNSLPER